MRGVISLAAALALPLSTESGAPFPERDLILFLTFCVILATLVVQGLSLPALIRALGLEDDGSREREETKGRIRVAEAALARIKELAAEEWVREDTAKRVRGLYNYRRSRFSARFFDGGDEDGLDVPEVRWPDLEPPKAQDRLVAMVFHWLRALGGRDPSLAPEGGIVRSGARLGPRVRHEVNQERREQSCQGRGKLGGV